MEIMQRRELWIHTHFVTNCVRLSHAQGREIEAALLPVLRQHHLVYGIHFEESRYDPGIRIVLERHSSVECAGADRGRLTAHHRVYSCQTRASADGYR